MWPTIALALGLACGLLLWIAIARSARLKAVEQRLEDSAESVRTVEREVEATKRTLASLVNSPGSLVLITDASDMVVSASREWSSLAARPGTQLVNQPISHVLMIGDIERLQRDARTAGGPIQGDVRIIGARRPAMSAMVEALRNCDGAVDGFVISCTGQEAAKRLEAVRREFVANVSHELRTPLTSIRAMAETLLDGARLDEEVAEQFLGSIIGEADRLRRIADDLLVLANAESRAPKLDRVNVSDQSRHVMDRMAPQAEQVSVKLSCRVADDTIAIADADAVDQILTNLLDNAIKYSHGGAVTMTIGTAEEAVEIQVADTGIGILAEHLPRLFERFYRVDTARSRASGGTGLGLAIVKHLAETAGGSVSVESEFNRGSVFTVRLPKAPDLAADENLALLAQTA